MFEFMYVINLTLIYSMYKFADIQVNVGMADFQHVVPVLAAQVRKRKWSNSQNDNGHLDKTRHQETDDGDAMMLVPPLFSVKDRPTKIASVTSVALSK